MVAPSSNWASIALSTPSGNSMVVAPASLRLLGYHSSRYGVCGGGPALESTGEKSIVNRVGARSAMT
jgi:hypothetical protein